MLDALFSAKGRMRRRDWWLWSMAIAIVFFIAGMLVHTWFGTTSLARETSELGKGALTPFQGWIIFANTVGYWPYVCLMAKRLHDRNRPGWLAGLWPLVGIPFFAVEHFSGVVADSSLRFAAGAAEGLLGFGVIGIFIWIVIDCGILDGTQGPNRYGPSPKGVGAQPEDIF